MNSPDTTPQIQAIEAAIEKIDAKPPVPGDAASAMLGSQLLQRENLRQDLMQQMKLNQEQTVRDQLEQVRLRRELLQTNQQQQTRVHLDQLQRDQQQQAKLRQEQIQRYEQQQARLRQEQLQRDQQQQARLRQEQMQRERDMQARQREREMQARQRQELLQKEQQARLKQEQIQREKSRQEQIQRERALQQKLQQEQAQKQILLAAHLKQEQGRKGQVESDKKINKNTDKNTGKAIPKTKEQLAKDEEARAFSSRTEMSLASIAFCSPLMLFGMGAAMSVFDNFSGKPKDAAFLDARKKSEATRRLELSAYAREQADKKFNEMVERKNISNLSNISDANATKFSAAKSEKRMDKADKPKVNRFVAAEAPALVRKNDSLEVKKLWKERQRLLEHLERVRGQGSLALVSRLVSQVETLDRSLKRLGCDPQA